MFLVYNTKAYGSVEKYPDLEQAQKRAAYLTKEWLTATGKERGTAWFVFGAHPSYNSEGGPGIIKAKLEARAALASGQVSMQGANYLEDWE